MKKYQVVVNLGFAVEVEANSYEEAEEIGYPKAIEAMKKCTDLENHISGREVDEL